MACTGGPAGARGDTGALPKAPPVRGRRLRRTRAGDPLPGATRPVPVPAPGATRCRSGLASGAGSGRYAADDAGARRAARSTPVRIRGTACFPAGPAEGRRMPGTAPARCPPDPDGAHRSRPWPVPRGAGSGAVLVLGSARRGWCGAPDAREPGRRDPFTATNPTAVLHPPGESPGRTSPSDAEPRPGLSRCRNRPSPRRRHGGTRR